MAKKRTSKKFKGIATTARGCAAAYTGGYSEENGTTYFEIRIAEGFQTGKHIWTERPPVAAVEAAEPAKVEPAKKIDPLALLLGED